MSALLDSLVGNKVEIITNDGRVVVGILKGLDQVKASDWLVWLTSWFRW